MNLLTFMSKRMHITIKLTKKYTHLEIAISAFRYSTRAVEADTLGGVGGLDGMKRLHRKIRPAAAHSGHDKGNKVDLSHAYYLMF